MKILHIINNMANGGAERLLVELLPEIRGKGNTVSLLVLVKGESLDSYIDVLQSKGIAVYFLQEKGSLYNPGLLFALKRFLSLGNYDIIHAHLFPTFYYTALIKRLFKRAERFYFTEHSSHNKRINTGLLKSVEKWVYRSFSHIIAISDGIKGKLVTWTGLGDRIVVIRNGVNLVQYHEADIIDLSALTGHEQDNFYLLMTARFSHPKRQDKLLEVMRILPENYVLLLAGTGEGMSNCQTMAQEFNISHRIVFLGHRIDVPSLMKSVDLNILCTEFEGMSGVCVEALASGKPFLGSDVPGVNDVVPSKTNLFSNDDVYAIAKKIEELSRADVRDLVRQQAAQAEKFSIERMASGYQALYAEGELK